MTLVHLGDRKNARYAFEEAVATSNSAAAAANFALFLLDEGDVTGAVVMYHRFQAQAEKVPGIEPEVNSIQYLLAQSIISFSVL